MQVLLVTGGENDNDGSLKSTEVLEAGGSWRQTGSLPSARFGLRAAVLDNKIFVLGGFTGGSDFAPKLKDILRYNTAYHTWKDDER